MASTFDEITKDHALSRAWHRAWARFNIAQAKAHEQDPKRRAMYIKAAHRERQNAVTRPWEATPSKDQHEDSH